MGVLLQSQKESGIGPAKKGIQNPAQEQSLLPLLGQLPGRQGPGEGRQNQGHVQARFEVEKGARVGRVIQPNRSKKQKEKNPKTKKLIK